MPDPSPRGPTPTVIWFALAIIVIGVFALMIRGVGST